MCDKKKTTQTTSSTVTPTNPQWVTDGTQALAGNIGTLSAQDPKSFFAGPSGLQQQGFDVFGRLGQQGADWTSQAAQMASGAGGAFGYNPAMMEAAQTGPAAHAAAERGYTGIANYFNPYEDTVVQNTMGDLDRARQLTQNGNGQGAIAAGQYGGSRQGVLDANADEGFLRAVGSTAGNLRHQGFTTAAGFADSDANRGTQVSMSNASADNSMSMLQAQLKQQAAMANQGANNQAWQYNAGANDAAAGRQLQGAQILGGLGQYGLGGLLEAGGVQQGLDQQQAGAPLSVMQMLSGSYGSLPLGLFNGQSQTGTQKGTAGGSTMDTVGKVAQTAANVAALFSDERLKTDVRPIGADERGRDWYDYRYVWDAPDVTRRGVMAQQILSTDPDAVSVHESGFLMVDYAKLEG